MKKMLLVAAAALIAAQPGNAGDEGRCRISPGIAEIVVGKDAAKPVEFAAAELNGIFARAFGSKLPVVDVPTPGKTSIFLGDCRASRDAGIDVSGLPRDAFTVKVEKGRVFIAGKDDPTCDLEKDFVGAGRVLNREHATLFGVYHFLERHLGVRFYFPGDIGTVVPRTSGADLPVGTETRSPVFAVRSIYFQGDGAVPDEKGAASRNSWKALAWLRLRLQTQSIPCCHGQRGFSFPERFHKTHPEYFALLKRDKKTLKRDVAEHQVSDCDVQMCHSSGLWDVMYEDCKAYLTGQPAASRGIVPRGHGGAEGLGWNRNCSGRFIDVMPQDGMAECLCETCQRAYDKTRKNFATELIWGNTARLAERLSADGLDCIITQMAYPPYRDVPKCALPSNVWVMVAEMGPWGEACPGKPEGEIAEVRAWTEKLGHKIWMWTYPSKFGRKATPGVPDMAPRAWAKYYARTVPYSYGAFCESECEKSIFHYLNYYMFSRIAWDESFDADAALDEHFRLMFGAAAADLARFYGELEEKWTKEVLFRWHDGSYGKDFSVSSDVRLWRVIYTPEVQARWTRLFDDAEKKVAADPDSLMRVRFIRREFLDYMKEIGARFDARADPEKGRAHYLSLTPQTNLIPMQTEPAHCVLTDFRKWASVRHSLKGKMKPSTKYRLSALIRLKNAVPAGPHHNGCGYFECYAGGWHWFPSAQAAFCGTFDWTYCSYEFTTPAKMGTATEDHVGFAFGRGTGEAWVDCFSLEEIGPAGSPRP